MGDQVRRGQPLAAVGNNGHSNEPHLHLQVQDSPASADAGKTYPIVFRNVHITRGGYWPWADSREVRTGDLVAAIGPARPVPATSTRSTARPRTSSARDPAPRPVVLLGGMGATTATWSGLRAALGARCPDLRLGLPRRGPLHGRADDDRRPSRVLPRRHAPRRPRPHAGRPGRPQRRRPHDPPLRRRAPGRCRRRRALDPTVASFARMFDDKEFRPRWDGTASADQVEQVTGGQTSRSRSSSTTPPSTPHEKVWSATVEAQWGTDEAAFAALAPQGTVQVAQGSGHNVYLDAQPTAVAAIRRVITAVSTGP